MAIAKLDYFTIDSVDPDGLAPFWAELLGVPLGPRLEDGQYVLLGRTAAEAPGVVFQRVPEPKAGKNRVHVDLRVDDLEEAAAAILRLGGSWLEPGITREVDGYFWRCMSDPEGNEFDIASDMPPGTKTS